MSISLDSFVGGPEGEIGWIFSGDQVAVAWSVAVLQAAAATKGQFRPGAESWANAHVASGDLAVEIARLKAEDGQPIIAHGGASVARSLIAQNLIDKYVLLIHPVALGKGLPIFSGLPAPRPLKLVSSKAFPGGSVARIYQPA